MNPFAQKQYLQPNAIEKVLKKIPQRNFLIDLNNYIADSTLEDLDRKQLLEFESKYGVKNSTEKYKTEIQEMFIEFVKMHLGISDSPYNNYGSAKTFQDFLGLSDTDFNQIYIPIMTEKLTESIGVILLSNKKYGSEEEAIVNKLVSQYGADISKAEAIVESEKNRIVQEYYDSIVEDERISPDEITQAEKLAKELDVKIKMSKESEILFEKYKRLWDIENRDLVPITPDILLPKQETCYLMCEVNLYENRKVIKGGGYAGPMLRVKIAKGLYYRAGAVGVKIHSEDDLTNIDSGNLYITNKKILFKGLNVNKNYKYDQIIDLIPYSDGIQIVKDSGKSPTFYALYESGEIITATIARIMKDNYL